MATRLGTSLAALLSRFGVTTTAAGSLDLQEEYSKRTAELLADERMHEVALAVDGLNAALAGEVRCPALKDVVSGEQCLRAVDHRPSGHHLFAGVR